MPDSHNTNNNPEFGPKQSRDYKAYQEFIRCSYVNVYNKVTEQAYLEYFKERDTHHAGEPETRELAAKIMDTTPAYQLKAWSIRNLRRLKYSQPDLGIDRMMHDQSGELDPEINALISDAGEDLILNPDLDMPDYFSWVDFHQQPGGVWRDDVDGLVYDYGRRTTNPNEADPNRVYQVMWDNLPKDREYKRVLDWGTGHGGGIVYWMENHPESEGYGVDVAAPCLKLAHVRAQEARVPVKFSQQDIAAMDYENEFFDMVFHMFMFHELPQQVTPDLFKEVLRVLKPGGVFIGMEISLIPDQPAQHIMQFTDGWLNNEPYMPASIDADYPAIAKAAGFSKAKAIGANRSREAFGNTAKNTPPKATWNYYVFEK
ncbi:MAG: class I SAM-dependent methyltransferase [Rhodospirillaceae bacterium]|jgi:ubiquinone/menaquinone biosynthesis C-methylase UbiE|nr:class I SAM-dependent methyltransferase [Rhodospirillaceae bacterium]